MNELSLFNTLFNNDFDNDMLPEFNFHATYATPKVDVKETKDKYLLEMDLPGRTEKDVNIELDGSVLTISSVKEEKKESKNENTDKNKWLIRERRSYEFSRRFTLPEDVNGEQISANFKNGVLTIDIPRKALPAAKRIAIKVA
ncbi:MAG: Hsp20/alpha crystallin family protein [Treponema sp.]|nr:Hsp20/alpha crystallin family protein [Treponema sp.]